MSIVYNGSAFGITKGRNMIMKFLIRKRGMTFNQNWWMIKKFCRWFVCSRTLGMRRLLNNSIAMVGLRKYCPWCWLFISFVLIGEAFRNEVKIRTIPYVQRSSFPQKGTGKPQSAGCMMFVWMWIMFIWHATIWSWRQWLKNKIVAIKLRVDVTTEDIHFFFLDLILVHFLQEMGHHNTNTIRLQNTRFCAR